MKWDVFISHASEDKDAIVRPLANELRSFGNSVWFDEFSLRPGDSIRRSIDHGIASSRFGVVVISPAFIEKEWTQKELDAFFARETLGEKVIIPLWHHVDFNDVKKFSPMLLDKRAVNSKIGVQRVAKEISAEVNRIIQFEQERDRKTERLEQERAALIIPSPEIYEEITEEHLTIDSTSWRANWIDEEFGHRVYRFDLVIYASSEVLRRIEMVKYFIPPTSPTDITDYKSGFRLKYITWSDLYVQAKVYVRNQISIVNVSCHVRLQEAGPRI